MCFELLLPLLFTDELCALNEAPAAIVECIHISQRIPYPTTLPLPHRTSNLFYNLTVQSVTS